MSIIISYLFLVFFIAFVFFGLIPGLGAFWVRSHWRQFRKRIVELSLKPFITYSEVSGSSEGLIGEYRFFGSLEAIQGENTIWVKSGDLSVAVNMEDVRVYILPSFSFLSEETEYESLEKILPDEEPQSILWSKISSLPMGTQVFVGGCLFVEKGRGIFKAQENRSLIAVIYDGKKESILKRAIWGGRQRNEYFNQFTVPSLITGSFSLILAAYIMLYNPLLRIPALFAITLSFFPISSMLPPGVILYFFYKRSWKQGRILRAERDLIRLPLRYFPAGSPRKEGLRISRFPTGEKCIEISEGVWNREEGIVKSKSKIFKLTEKLPLRGPVQPGLKKSKDGSFNIYGKYLEENDNCYIMKPDDPMAEMVAIPGDPEKLSYRRQKWARFYELLSALFIFSDLLINLFFVLFILHYYIK
ncbi:MAG: hypothetical protein GXP33_08110 [Spirochaetes bacterium]|nr:hypothetical protein [Spirochaetota bacterium]